MKDALVKPRISIFHDFIIFDWGIRSNVYAITEQAVILQGFAGMTGRFTGLGRRFLLNRWKIFTEISKERFRFIAFFRKI